MSAFIYDEKKNPKGTWIDGVPLRDLTAEEFKALKPHLQAAVKASPYYTAASAKKTAAKTASQEAED